MKYEMTPEDNQIMERDLKQDRVLKHLKNLSFYKFAIGDVLIREEKYRTLDKTEGFEWKTSVAACDLPYKYVYVFENELGIGYIRRLSVNGRKFVERSTCVTEFDPDQTRFVLDPEYADHMLLSNENEDFDAKSRYDEIKKKREQIHRKNKKLRLSFSDVYQAVAWMKTLKVGDQIWWGYGIAHLYKEPYLVREIDIRANPAECIVKIAQNPSNPYCSNLYAGELMRYYIFTQRPTFLEDVIN